MRLLNLNTLELRGFIDSERPPYVILSHTWEVEEVSLQALHGPNVQNMAGYFKILNFCRQGAENGFEWGWVDTCCIDKTSSAELSEAINSMFRWYQEADTCYAFLSDVFGLEKLQSSSTEEQFAPESLVYTRLDSPRASCTLKCRFLFARLDHVWDQEFFRPGNLEHNRNPSYCYHPPHKSEDV
jgi:hypothetical protein